MTRGEKEKELKSKYKIINHLPELLTIIPLNARYAMKTQTPLTLVIAQY